MSLFQYKMSELHKFLLKKELTVSDLVDESLRKIKEIEDDIHSFITINEEEVRKVAHKLNNKQPGSIIFGLPIALKDNIVTNNLRTTCASKMLENFQPIYNATVVEKLESGGAITIGKTNMDEFAMGSSTENSYFYPTYNPWNKKMTAGGSSGGSAAAVAAEEVVFSLGSDTGGSIRQPAAFCGVVGMKPTYGRVSRYGLIAFASSLDQIGPITRSVEDNAYVLQAISGKDTMDATSAPLPIPNWVETLTGEVKGLKIAVPKEYFGEGVSKEVKDTIQKALMILEGLGAHCEEVSLPHTKYAVAVYYLISSCEASSNLARYDGIRYGYQTPNADTLLELYEKTRAEGFGTEVKRRILFGTYALSSHLQQDYFQKAQKIRTLIKKDFKHILEEYDCIIGPTTRTPAFKVGEENNSINRYENDVLTIPVNLAGIPAISIPCGYVKGLPVGMQIIGRPFDEETVYRVAYAVEQSKFTI